MYVKTQNTVKKPHSLTEKNTVESLNDFGTSLVNGATDVFDQMFGNVSNPDRMTDKEAIWYNQQEQQKPVGRKVEKSIFNFRNYHEKEIVTREIQALTNEIKKAVVVVKHESSELIKDAEKLSIEGVSENPGVYHQRFLEVILNLLQALRAKIGESRTWMQAMISKKKKRGSLFVARTKEKGTQYSLSDEQKITRSVQ